MLTFDENKTKALLAYIASKVDVGKTKLMKLLYLIDFTAYERTGKAITNDLYKHWALGPVPTKTWRGMRGNLIEGVLDVTHEERGAGTYMRYTPISVDVSSLSTEELKVVDEVIKEFGTMGQQELVDMLHRELPYIVTGENELIPYFLAPYRNYEGFTKKEIGKIQKNKKYISGLKKAFKESQKSEYRAVVGGEIKNYSFVIGL